MSDTLNEFRAGVIAEREFAATVVAGDLFGVAQWHARCVHLAERAEQVDRDVSAEFYGRLAVALFTLEALADPELKER